MKEKSPKIDQPAISLLHAEIFPKIDIYPELAAGPIRSIAEGSSFANNSFHLHQEITPTHDYELEAEDEAD